MKIFLLSRLEGFDPKRDKVCPLRPACVIFADSVEEAARFCGGRYEAKRGTVHFPKELFTQGEYSERSGCVFRWYHQGPLRLAIVPWESEVVLNIYELPSLQAIKETA